MTRNLGIVLARKVYKVVLWTILRHSIRDNDHLARHLGGERTLEDTPPRGAAHKE